mmetsp:Transcript_27511/g.42072  ORF Transcript_27511/g.42072 Transcript_27511/m.42072 type:complete len:211 (-) Transcript_27511:1200-1832(-)
MLPNLVSGGLPPVKTGVQSLPTITGSIGGRGSDLNGVPISVLGSITDPGHSRRRHGGVVRRTAFSFAIRGRGLWGGCANSCDKLWMLLPRRRTMTMRHSNSRACTNDPQREIGPRDSFAVAIGRQWETMSNFGRWATSFTRLRIASRLCRVFCPLLSATTRRRMMWVTMHREPQLSCQMGAPYPDLDGSPPYSNERIYRNGKEMKRASNP